MNGHIHCSVNNCHYWKQGNMCDADEIVVVPDSFGAQYPGGIDAPQANTIAPTPVGQCMDTCCKTFIPHGADMVGVDGATRV